jgi:hypothetical protein
MLDNTKILNMVNKNTQDRWLWPIDQKTHQKWIKRGLERYPKSISVRNMFKGLLLSFAGIYSLSLGYSGSMLIMNPNVFLYEQKATLVFLSIVSFLAILINSILYLKVVYEK